MPPFHVDFCFANRFFAFGLCTHILEQKPMRFVVLYSNKQVSEEQLVSKMGGVVSSMMSGVVACELKTFPKTTTSYPEGLDDAYYAAARGAVGQCCSRRDMQEPTLAGQHICPGQCGCSKAHQRWHGTPHHDGPCQWRSFKQKVGRAMQANLQRLPLGCRSTYQN